MSAFRHTPDGSLDRAYLRVCAVYRCCSRYGATKEQAAALADRPIRSLYRKPGWLRGTIEIWYAGPLRNRDDPR